MIKKKLKSTCEKGSRASDFFKSDVFNLNGVDYFICLQKGKNTLVIGSTMVYRDGYTYLINASANPDDWESLSEEEKSKRLDGATKIGLQK